MEWISVEDELPEPNKDVLVNYIAHPPLMEVYKNKVCSRLSYEGYAIARDRNADSFLDDNGFKVGNKQVVTHWMPLPEPPSESAKQQSKSS